LNFPARAPSTKVRALVDFMMQELK